jgi:SAM-dependent methyltransferase
MPLPRLKSEALKIFLISFLILFFELVCIRWLSSYILYLGYFTNFVLLGSLLGIGAGALLAARPTQLIRWLPGFLFVFLTVILFVRAEVNSEFEDLIYFTSGSATVQLPPYILLPFIFIGVTIIFTLLAQGLGVLFNKFTPLKAYNLNILGSLAGIATFTLLSFLSLPAWVWFLVAVILIIPFLPVDRWWGINIILLLGVVGIVAASDYVSVNIWSPYYRLNLIRLENGQLQAVGANQSGELDPAYVLMANGVGHQQFTTIAESEPFYQLPYTLFKEKPVYQNALIVGSGGGNDVAIALAHGVQHIDAVEIDPRIVALGQHYHPENPYADPRVTVHIDDARSFLEKSNTQYDVVIFALPDSLVLASTSSSVRLESYLFTEESFERVKDHLKPNGLFVLYNYYRNEWLIDKITSMLAKVFEEPPLAYRYSEPRYKFFATIFAGPKTKDLDPAQPGLTQPDPIPGLASATDDWPFLYLREPSLPSFYGNVLLVLLLFSFFYIQKLAPKGAINQYGWPFFFMGCAFTLLETRSIVQFLLLFGATWLVNSLVFFAILLVVLIANWLAARYKFSQLWLLYTLLLIALVLNFALPLKTLLFDNLAVRYIAATVLLFSPIFFANLIYSTIFRDTTRANVAFGANLLGTMVGGATEYLALYFGYQNLVIFAAIFYFLAFYFVTRSQRVRLIPIPLQVDP